MIRAIEGQPHRDSPPRRSGLERLLTWPSVTFFVLGLMIYFVFIPLVLMSLEGATDGLGGAPERTGGLPHRATRVPPEPRLSPSDRGPAGGCFHL